MPSPGVFCGLPKWPRFPHLSVPRRCETMRADPLCRCSVTRSSATFRHRGKKQNCQGPPNNTVRETAISVVPFTGYSKAGKTHRWTDLAPVVYVFLRLFIKQGQCTQTCIYEKLWFMPDLSAPFNLQSLGRYTLNLKHTNYIKTLITIEQNQSLYITQLYRQIHECTSTYTRTFIQYIGRNCNSTQSKICE